MTADRGRQPADDRPRNGVYAYPCPDPGCLLPPRQPCRTRAGKPHPARLALAASGRTVAWALLYVDEIKAELKRQARPPGPWDDDLDEDFDLPPDPP